MSVNRNKSLQAAERLIRQGKIEAALTELNRMASGAPSDLLTLNRIGDLLARQDRKVEAIDCYRKIAGQFTRQGFYPKAVAIQKKILRLDATDVEALLQLGDLFIRQKLPGEARVHLLAAAAASEGSEQPGSASEIYKRLIEIEPNVASHHHGLARSRAAEGDERGAGEELVAIADQQLKDEKPDEAMQTYQRAAELLPDSGEPALGIYRCHLALADADGARKWLIEQAARGDTPGTVLGELALLHVREGRSDEAAALLANPRFGDVADGVIVELFDAHLSGEGTDAFWDRFDPILESWSTGPSPERGPRMLDRIAEREPHGHIPALQRLLEANRATADREGTVMALERLIPAYKARSMDEEASLMADRLRDLAPGSPLLEHEPEPAEPEFEATAEPGPVGTGTPDPEAPAVPLSRADQEFVTARLTQAEILEKYGLRAKAVEQVREVVNRFPGHEAAQERRVLLIRGESSPEELQRALIGLAVAARASGNLDGARRAADEARLVGDLDPAVAEELKRLGLLTETVARAPRTPGPPVASAAEPDSPVTVSGAGRDDDAVVIDFDDFAVVDPPETELPPVVAAPEAESRPPSVEAAPVKPAPPPATSGPNAESVSIPVVDDADLESLSAALGEGQSELAPEPEAEQSLQEVFAQFRQQVELEVGKDDHRTHYDLGVAYKEMGLTVEGIEEFKLALDAPELTREAAAMIAVCHRELGDEAEAESWYRKAISACGPDLDAIVGLRYELAELLLESGKRQAALDAFREVVQVNPSFRDAQARVADLEPAAP